MSSLLLDFVLVAVTTVPHVPVENFSWTGSRPRHGDCWPLVWKTV